MVFLPPYSPDYNPIELVFSQVKKWMQHHGETLADQDPADVITGAFGSIGMDKIKLLTNIASHTAATRNYASQTQSP